MRLCWEMHKRQQMSGFHFCSWKKKKLPYKNSTFQKDKTGRRKKHHFRNKVKIKKKISYQEFELDLVRNPVSGSVAWFFAPILEFIMIYEHVWLSGLVSGWRAIRVCSNLPCESILCPRKTLTQTWLNFFVAKSNDGHTDSVNNISPRLRWSWRFSLVYTVYI